MNIDKLAYTVTEAANALGIGRTTIYKLMSLGQIKAHKIGSRTVIKRPELERFLEQAPSVA